MCRNSLRHHCVYIHNNYLAENLQKKFFIPFDKEFQVETFLESAAELSVQNDLALNERASKVEIEKQINPPKDVDVYYEVGSTRVSLEVKCPNEIQVPQNSFTLKTAGRIPDHLEKYRKIKTIFDNPTSGQILDLAKNNDNKLKDFLDSANQKFSPLSSVGDLNVLFVACGACANIQDWWHYLYGGEGILHGNPILSGDKLSFS